MLLFPVNKSKVQELMAAIDIRQEQAVEKQSRKYTFDFVKDEPLSAA